MRARLVVSSEWFLVCGLVAACTTGGGTYRASGEPDGGGALGVPAAPPPPGAPPAAPPPSDRPPPPAPPPPASGCTPACEGRVCGPDPACATSCGACGTGTCTAEGQCESSTSDGPHILSLGTNVSTLRSDERLIVTVIVTDPDGIDDVIGGSLLDPTSDASYGAFATSAAEGAYEISLTWDQMQVVRRIDAPDPGAVRTFRARFFDVAGNAAERDFSVTLRCSTDGESACSGVCVDLQTSRQHCGRCDNPVPGDRDCRGGTISCYADSPEVCGDACADLSSDERHCGRCGHACPDGADSLGCSDGRCLAESYSYDRTSCDSVCGGLGRSCAGGTAYFLEGGVNVGYAVACGAVPDLTGTGSWLSLACACVVD